MIKTSIGKKAMRLIAISISIMAVCLVCAISLSVWKLRFDTVGQNEKQDAEIFASFIAQQIDVEVSSIRSYVSSPWWHEAVREANARYSGWEPKVIKEYMARMDGAWINAAVDAPLIQERLTSPMGRRLKALAEEDLDIAEMFLTDQYGGLVASSRKTSDFFQADEEWWQRAYNDGKGDIFIGQIELDESSQTISNSLAVPVKDAAGELIGISKTSLDISVFFKPMAQYKFGKTGHAALQDEQGNVLYHPGVIPMSKSSLSASDLDRLLKNKHGFALIAGCTGATALVAVARVKSPYLEANGIHWVVVVSQEQNEIFTPSYRIFGGAFLLTIIFSFLIIFFLQKRLNRIFISPLRKIGDGVQCFSAGDLAHRIDVRTNDEFESLAGSLNEMAGHLKQTMTSRDSLAGQVKQREQAEQSLQEVETRFMSIFYASKDAVFLLDGGKCVDCNLAAIRMLECPSRDNILMADLAQFSPPAQPDGKNSVDKVHEMIKLTLDRGFHRFKWVYRKANGEDSLGEMSFSSIVIHGKMCIHGVLVDISRQERDERRLREIQSKLKEKTDELELALQASLKSREILTSMLEDNNQNRDDLERNLKELKRSQSMLINSEKLASLGRLVSEIAHEVNNPLMIISGNAQLSLMNESLSAEDKASLEVIMKECQRAKNVIRRVLRFAKPSKGDVKEVEIGECLEGIVGIVEQQFLLSHNVQIKKEYLKNKIYISVDEQQIQEVFMNLLNNAKEMMLKGGSITITTSVEGALLRIDFKDTGPGMSEETMQKIMEPFFTTKETGTGIGLAICYGIVKAHNGDIRFESELGKGTTATVFLPLEEKTNV